MNYDEYLANIEQSYIDAAQCREQNEDAAEKQFKETMPNLWLLKGLFNEWTRYWAKKNVAACEKCYSRMEVLGINELHAELFGRKDFLKLILDASDDKFKSIFN